ncbi:probable protein phosphatase 2C 6 [Pistacia vera]|uniref:probable protein phosphatase 2C 6 n=1 Tax=Pistacia vera TaxID=55513 RepID=UPI0012635A44|nr:probable protein phosphatase 2C 6 [Pistacia vera]
MLMNKILECFNPLALKFRPSLTVYTCIRLYSLLRDELLPLLQLEREDELARIRDKGGRIVQWGCLRVEGVLSMSRAIGDHGLKPWVISVPEVTFTPRTEDDEFLILASDGLWDVLSNDVAVRLAREEFRYQRRQPKKDDTSSHPPALNVAKELLKRAFTAYTCDNVSVVVVDLKLPRRRPHQKL